VAIFDPVELEGTTVSRASVHNISIMKALKLGIGDRITVYKANMIIPQIAENLTQSGNMEIPDTCPACGGRTEVRSQNDAESLYCTNENCSAKKIKAYTLFVSRDALNIDGLSEATLEKFIGHGFIHTYADLFHLDRHRDTIVEMDGFGEKSYANLIESTERARHTTLPRFLYGLGIPNVGVANARLICRHFDYDLERIRTATEEELSEIEGLGGVIAASVTGYFQDPANAGNIDELLPELEFEQPQEQSSEQVFSGKTFVITGSVEHFANRNELKAFIEERGGKVTGSVSKNTDYLINNDTASASSKNRKARDLGIPVLSEEDFLALTEEE
jgi:DNA ligase (NAD+)